MANPPHILRIRRIPLRPMIHLYLLLVPSTTPLNPLLLLLRLPNRIQQNINSALTRHLRITVQDRNAQHDPEPLLPLPLPLPVLRNNRPLPV